MTITCCELCRGDKNDTRGTAFVVYEDIYDAKAAVDHLSGFNVCGRYLIVLYYQPSKMNPTSGNNIAESNAAKKQEIDNLRNQHGL
jgi:pre-mRNA branch site protein p14